MMRCMLAAVLVACATVQARDPLATAVATNGPHDLTNVLISIPLARLEGKHANVIYGVREAGAERQYPCQMLLRGRIDSADRKLDLVVLIPEFKANERKTLEIVSLPPPPGIPPLARLAWMTAGADTIELRDRHHNQRVIASFTRFAFEPNAVPKADVLKNPTIKPYHHVYAADKARLTNGPDGKFPHHRGIYFGFNQITYGDKKKADVWHCRNGEHQQAAAGRQIEIGNLLGQHRIQVDWNGQDGGTFASETRELAFMPMEGGLLVDFRSRLTTELPDGVKLDGDPQHAGFHFRANAAVEAVAKETYFLRPDGKGEPGQEKNWDPKTKKGPVNLPWNAMSFMLDGKRRTVVYLDHPKNPKEARQSERTYGRIGTYFEYMLTPDKPLFVRYRLWIQDGEATAEQCEALSRAFTAEVKVEVK